MVKEVQADLDEKRRPRRAGKPEGSQLRNAQGALDRKRKAAERIRIVELLGREAAAKAAQAELSKCRER